jgi:DNA polymerase V
VGLRLAQPTDDTAELIAAGRQLLELIFRPGYDYKKLGVWLSDLRPLGQVQGDLFDGRDRSRHRRLWRAVDAVNDRYGRRVLAPAAAGTAPASWQMRQAQRSPAYLSDWSQLPQARTDGRSWLIHTGNVSSPAGC